MDTREAYNKWSQQYDTNVNRTRDLEAAALRTVLAGISFNSCLEIGCGTGKNTEWFVTKAQRITAIDLSEAMLAKAKEKLGMVGVEFLQADITLDWGFAREPYELVSFSLVLEHIEDLDPIFRATAKALVPGGHVYIGELHPFKQYSGSKARFDTEEGQQIVTCFNHHISDFLEPAKRYGLEIESLHEYFDEGNRAAIPRILTLLLKKV